MVQKIHCDLLDIYGVDWTGIGGDQIDCIISRIHEMDLMGGADDLFGFVGTTDIDSVVGGFFVIQFPTEFLSYGRNRTAKKKRTTPAERVFFVLLLRDGRVLLQNRRFQILPIDMEAVHTRFKQTLATVLTSCKVGNLVSLTPTCVKVTKSDLMDAYQSSNRVSRLQVNNPDPKQIPEEFVYHNPERYRNKILRDSRLHDYPRLSGIRLAARKDADLRETHLGQDLVHATTDDAAFLMEFDDQNDRHRRLRQLKKLKIEFYVDIDDETVSMETLQRVVEILGQEAALGIGRPSSSPPDVQIRLF